MADSGLCSWALFTLYLKAAALLDNDTCLPHITRSPPMTSNLPSPSLSPSPLSLRDPAAFVEADERRLRIKWYKLTGMGPLGMVLAEDMERMRREKLDISEIRGLVREGRGEGRGAFTALKPQSLQLTSCIFMKI